MKTKVCKLHTQYIYTLKDKCPECKKPSIEAHYKYIRKEFKEKLSS